MATSSTTLFQSLSLRSPKHAPLTVVCKAQPPASHRSAVAFPSRRQWLLLLTATTTLKAVEFPSAAKDIPFFGLRRKLEKVEEEAEVVIKDGVEAAEKGIETAEKGIESAEKGVEAAVGFGGLAQAGAVAAAEVVGVVVASSVVNGILGPEA